MTLNYSEDLESIQYTLVSISSKSLWPEVPVTVQSMGQMDLFKKLFIFNRSVCEKYQYN